ncbi:MAG: hypothetical protein D6B25_19570 [Desulfobulbaceae bacterium]|nr:MAG: hypothetical protein D6B25_19570 [Desulfobulbaceae bacterium]
MPEWKDEYKIGISAVDAQHKRLFQLIGELQAAIHDGLRSSHIVSLLDSLDQYKTRHFNLEEQYMNESDYPGLAEQREAHAAFTAKFQELKSVYQDKGMSPQLVNDIKSELIGWVQDHVTGLDREFGQYYQDWKK